MSSADPHLTSSEPALEQYRARIRRHIRGLVRDRADAEDLTQETFLRAHQRMPTLREPAALGVWLYRIATHVCYDHLRRIRRLPGRVGDDGRLDEVPAEAPSLARAVENAEMSACGERFLDDLPAGYRSVILLHDFLGLTSAEIARLLRCTEGSVKIRLHRARARFRAALESGCDLYRDERGVLVGEPKPRTR